MYKDMDLADILSLLLGSLRTLFIVSRDLDLNTHIILSQPRDAHTCPDGLMIGHPFLEVPHHGLERLIVERYMVRVDAEDLLPAFPTGILQVEIHVGEGLVDLGVDFAVDRACCGVPAT